MHGQKAARPYTKGRGNDNSAAHPTGVRAAALVIAPSRRQRQLRRCDFL